MDDADNNFGRCSIRIFHDVFKSAEPLRKKYSLFRFVAQYGIAVPFAIAYAFGILIGDIAPPKITWNIVPIHFGEIFSNYSIFGVGVPPLSMFLQALPLAIAAYIIAFGDVLVVSSLINRANEVRKDEKIVFSASRNSIIVAIRNGLEALFMPFLGLAGPQWTAGQALVTTRLWLTPGKRSIVIGAEQPVFSGV